VHSQLARESNSWLSDAQFAKVIDLLLISAGFELIL